MFDTGILRSTEFDFPVISVGNITVGGTGKTPHVEYLLKLLKGTWKTAMLSRGYKRKTSGFVVADENSDSTKIGDEPYQIYCKNKDIVIAVDEDRVAGIKKIKKNNPDIELIVLDDAFQHRKVKPGYSILLTDYYNLYYNDTHLPGGNLRENKCGRKRADIIIVTKCPENISPIDLRVIEKEINVLPYQSLFFSSYKYGDLTPVFENETNSNPRTQPTTILAVTGIANPQPMIEFLSGSLEKVEKMTFPDHYSFQKKDLKNIAARFEKIDDPEKIIVVTEKDAARLISIKDFPEDLKKYIYKLPIQVNILNGQENEFKSKILSYVAENTRNSRIS